MTALDRRQIGAGLAILAFLCLDLLCSSGCRDPYTTALQSGATMRATMVAAEQSLADACHVKHVACLESHGAQTPAFATCAAPCIKGLRIFATYTRPGFNTGLIAFVAGVQLAKAIGDKAGLLDLLKPLACAAGRGSVEWLHLMPVSARATIDAIARGVSGFTCPKEVP